MVEDWRIPYQRTLSGLPQAEFLSPDDPTLDESQPLTVFGHDCFLVREADVVVVNATTKLGVGTAQEMLIAKYFEKLVVTILPRNSHHRRQGLRMHAGIVDDWIHPFIYSTSDHIAEDVDEAFAWLHTLSHTRATHIVKDLGVINQGIEAYLEFRKRSDSLDH
jgi:hypothetical protein